MRVGPQVADSHFQHFCYHWSTGLFRFDKTRSSSKCVLSTSSSDFLCEELSARASRPPVKPISQTFYASRHRRSGGKNQSPKSLPVAVVVGYFPVPKAEAPSYIATLTAIIDKFGDFCARNRPTLSRGHFLLV